MIVNVYLILITAIIDSENLIVQEALKGMFRIFSFKKDYKNIVFFSHLKITMPVVGKCSV